MVFYSKSGQPIAYTEDGQHLYLFSGKPVAYLSNDAVYSFSGEHLGWFEDGWIRDTERKCVFFTSQARSGPAKPIKRMKPIKHVKQMKPIKGVKQVRCVKGIKSRLWSDLSGEQFFV